MALFRAIASGDPVEASRLLVASPSLARESCSVGASRSSSLPYFLRSLEHYVYSGDTALHVAARAYRVDIAKALVARGANPGARNRRGAEPLHYGTVGRPGSQSWNPEAQAAMIDYLIHLGADPDSVDASGVAPIHLAVRTRCAAAVRALLAHGADPGRKNRRGSTPLHLAVRNTGRGGSGAPDAKDQQAEIIGLLLERGAPLDEKDGRGKSVNESIASDWIRELLHR